MPRAKRISTSRLPCRPLAEAEAWLACLVSSGRWPPWAHPVGFGAARHRYHGDDANADPTALRGQPERVGDLGLVRESRAHALNAFAASARVRARGRRDLTSAVDREAEQLAGGWRLRRRPIVLTSR